MSVPADSFRLGDQLLCVDVSPFKGVTPPLTLGKVYTPFYDYSDATDFLVDVRCDDGSVRELQKSRFRLVGAAT